MRLCLLAISVAPFLCAAERPASASDPASAFAAAGSMLDAGQVAGAAQAFERITQSHPEFAEAWFALGVSYTQLGKSEEAVAALRSYLKRKPESADGRAVLGILLFHGGQIAGAKPELERAVRLDPSQHEAAKTLGRVYTLSGSPAKTIALLRPRVPSPKSDDEARTVLASAYLASGDPAAAGALLDPVLASGRNTSLQTYIVAAMAARDTRDLPRALAICERAAKDYPNSEQPENLAASFPVEALIARTSQRVQRIKSNPNDVAEMIAVGRVMMAADKGKRGVPLNLSRVLLERAVRLDPGNAAAWYHYGRCLQAAVEPEEARAAFDKALSAVRDDELQVLILGQIGFAESRLRHAGAAADAFRKSLELNRKLERHIAAAAWLYFQFQTLNEREEESRALLNEILRWEPLFCPALLERAKSDIAGNLPEKAAEAAALVTRNTEDPQLLHSAHYLLVKAYRALGQEQSAQLHADWIRAHDQRAGEEQRR